MPRKPGDKDKKPRRLSPRSLANLLPKNTVPGFKSVNGRVYAPAHTADWYGRMTPLDRGKFIASGTVDEMRNSPDPLVHQFVHGNAVGPLTDRRRGGGYEDDLFGIQI